MQKNTNNPHNIQPGQTVWLVGDSRYRVAGTLTMPKPYEVEHIGEKHFTLKHFLLHKFCLQTLCATGTQKITSTRVYTSMQQIIDLRQTIDLSVKIRKILGHSGPITNIDINKLKQIAQILEV